MKYDNGILEQVKSYTYLGIEICANGSFRSAEQCMTDKAKKALFKLKSLLYGSSVKPSTCIKLFDQLIKPIALYGSEIWGVGEFKLNNITSFMKTLEKFAAEKVNLSFSKFALGVHQKAQNSAVRGELGRTPLGIDIITNILMYYMHMTYSSTNTLLHEALDLSKTCGQKSWANKTELLVKYLQNNNYFTSLGQRKEVKQAIIKKYKEHWKTNILTERKMRTYITFKTRFQYENYLHLLTGDFQKYFTRFRISAHNLAIERGRYNRPPIPCELRICPNCSSGIQDENHFLLECNEYDISRQELYTKITPHCPNFHSLSNENKLKYLLTAEGTILKEVASFIKQHMP